MPLNRHEREVEYCEHRHLCDVCHESWWHDGLCDDVWRLECPEHDSGALPTNA